MFRHNLAAALRQLWRNRTATLLNLIGLAIGLGCFVFADGTASYLSGRGAALVYKNTFLVTERMTAPGQSLPANAGTAPVLAPPLQSELPAGYLVGRFLPVDDSGVRAGTAKAFLKVFYTDPDMLSMFVLPGARPDALEAPHSVVLSTDAAARLFGNRSAIGQNISINGVDASVTAVTNPPAAPTPFQKIGGNFDVLASWDIYDKLNPAGVDQSNPNNWFNFIVSTYIQAPAADHETIEGLDAKIATFGDRHIPKGDTHAYFAVTPGYAYLNTMSNLAVRSDVTGMTVASILDLLGVIIMAIAVANYINLATAQVLTRSREVRIRRLLGATAADLLRQHAIETSVIVAVSCSLLAFAGAFLLSITWPAIGASVSLVLSDSIFWQHVAIAVLAATFAAGVYPAILFATMAKAGPVQNRRSQNWLRGVLTCLQFASASTLLIFALETHDQNIALRQAGEPAGVDPVVAIESDPGSAIASFRSALRRSPAIRAVSSVIYTPWSGGVSWDGLHRELPNARTITTIYNAVGDDYSAAMSMSLIAGRQLSALHGGDGPPPNNGTIANHDINIVIDRDLAAQFGWRNPAMAVGEVLDAPDMGHFRIVGVTENRPTNMVVLGIHGDVYWADNQLTRITLVRLDPARIAQGLSAIDAAWNDAAPQAPLKREFVTDLFESGYHALNNATRTVTFLVIPAFLLALAGLAGMAIEVARSHLREIAIRKMVGASTWDAARLLLWKFAPPLLIANVIAWPLAFAGVTGYLSLFTTRTEITIWPFLIGLFGTLAISALAVADETRRTAGSSPAEVLRAE